MPSRTVQDDCEQEAEAVQAAAAEAVATSAAAEEEETAAAAAAVAPATTTEPEPLDLDLLNNRPPVSLLPGERGKWDSRPWCSSCRRLEVQQWSLGGQWSIAATLLLDRYGRRSILFPLSFHCMVCGTRRGPHEFTDA